MKSIKKVVDLPLWKHQEECTKEKDKINTGRCLIHVWCGTGKTRIFTKSILVTRKKLNVIVFPTLGLIKQYEKDFNLDIKSFNSSLVIHEKFSD